MYNKNIKKNINRSLKLKKYTFIEELNAEQKLAATTLNGPVLILAGAGSGKTKTIVARTALLVAEKLAQPKDILIMTFTRKAAKEMRDRGNKILEDNGLAVNESPLFTTFHAWGVNFLKAMPDEVLQNFRLTPKFSLINDSAQETIIKRLIPECFDLSDPNVAKSLKAPAFLLPLSNIQNRLIPYENIDETFKHLNELNENDPLFFGEIYPGMIDDDVIKSFAELYVRYKADLRNNNSIDFDDLIILPYRVMKAFPDIRKWVRNSYKYLMVDEFQDTNGSQLALIGEMLNEQNNICVVGDDAQSIYGWRGSQVRFILNFDKKFKNAAKINLKTNYRSVASVVEKANSLLSHLTEKHPFKENLTAFNQNKGTVEGFKFYSADDEATYVADKISFLAGRGATLGEIAVIYRNNAISRKFEEALIKNGIPYHVVKGKALLDRKACKQMIGYLSLLKNPKNALLLSSLLCDAGIITEERLGKFYADAKANKIDFLDYFMKGYFAKVAGLRKVTVAGIQSVLDEVKYFVKLEGDLKEGEENSRDQYEEFIETFFKENRLSFGYAETIRKYGAKEKVSEDSYLAALGGQKNLESLKSLVLRYDSIDEFLGAVLIEPEAEDEKNEKKVHLITTHSAKGLEFEYVFCVGAIEGVFPSSKSARYPNRLEEERRVAYVAFTRAKKALFVSGAIMGGYYGKYNESASELSRFVFEAEINIQDKTRNSSIANPFTNRYNYGYNNFKK